ncbi:MAG: hypothetical protein QNJ97_17710 [Myxococcota bacterium]|nr:hypothetical protein [Myxococcota bacterium]
METESLEDQRTRLATRVAAAFARINTCYGAMGNSIRAAEANSVTVLDLTLENITDIFEYAGNLEEALDSAVHYIQMLQAIDKKLEEEKK